MVGKDVLADRTGDSERRPAQVQPIVEIFKARLKALTERPNSGWTSEMIDRTFLIVDGPTVEFATEPRWDADIPRASLVNRRIEALIKRAKDFGVKCPDGKIRLIKTYGKTAINPAWSASPSWLYVVVEKESGNEA